VRPVRYHEAAQGELLFELGYLESQSKGLGRRFLHEVRRTEKLLAEFPEAGVEIASGIRKAPLRTYRFSLIYAVEAEALLVLAVAHHSRRPGYWVGRA
jgi:plasmid stabilization system protein ParE